MMQRLIFSILYAMLTCFALQAATTSNADIDKQIEQLEEQKKAAQSQADFSSEEAERLQFQDWLGYREQLEEEERYRNQAKAIQEQIDQLKAQRKK